MTAPSGVLEASLYVDDLHAAESFYRDVLGLTFHSRDEGRHVFFRCGATMVLLFRPQATRASEQEVPPHGCEGPGHLCFAIEEDAIEAWRQKLARCGVAIEQEIAWENGGHSIYFRDPAGNSLELATPRLWQREDTPRAGTSHRSPGLDDRAS